MDSLSGIHYLKDHTELHDHFINKESKAQRVYLTCLWSQTVTKLCQLFPPNYLEVPFEL